MSNDTEQRFRLEIQVRVQQLTRSPGYQGMPGEWYASSSSGLEIRDSLDLTVGSFMDAAGVLSRFHELAEALKSERS